jgi:hypothetical protein
MPGCSLPSDSRAEGVIPSYFPIQNQANSFASHFAFHGDERDCPSSVRPSTSDRQAREQQMHGNSQSL